MRKYLLKQQAVAEKYRAMTNPYILPAEGWMLDNVIEDMERGKADYALVEIKPNEVEVWRK